MCWLIDEEKMWEDVDAGGEMQREVGTDVGKKLPHLLAQGPR